MNTDSFVLKPLETAKSEVWPYLHCCVSGKKSAAFNGCEEEYAIDIERLYVLVKDANEFIPNMRARQCNAMLTDDLAFRPPKNLNPFTDDMKL
jgi:hypothetical protein